MILILKSPIYNGKKKGGYCRFLSRSSSLLRKISNCLFYRENTNKNDKFMMRKQGYFLIFSQRGGAISSISGEHFSFVKKLPFFL